MLEANSVRVNERNERDGIIRIVRPIRSFDSRCDIHPSDTTHNYRPRAVRGCDSAQRCEMRAKTRMLAGLMAVLGIAMTGLTGCQTHYGGMTLPSGRYLEHYPQYFAPDPQHPLPRELASMEDPEGVARRAGGLGGGIAPVAPPPPVPAPGIRQ